MGNYVAELALIGGLVVLNSVFAGSEIALISLRDSQLDALERHGRGGRALTRLAREPNRFLATIQIGITLAGFLASATAAVSLAKPLVGVLGFFGGAAETVAVVLVTMVLTFFTLVFGELAPKRLAMQSAESWALLVARPLTVLSTLMRPVVWLLGRATDLTVRAFGGDPDVRRDQVTEEEIRDMIAARRGFTPEQRKIISGAFEMAGRTLRQIVIPRRDVVYVTADTPVREARDLLVAAGHSRAPVTQGHELGDVIGVVHLRHLLDGGGSTGERARPALLLPATLSVSDALRAMRAERRQLALVVDERGTIDGIVTLEDILEEIVGEIYDESDRDLQKVVHEPGPALLLPGAFPLHDLRDLNVDLPDEPPGPYTTVAGLLLSRLGHIPTRPGETVRLGEWEAEVVAIERHAITRIRLRAAR
jgi:putative hemolysin